MKLLTLKTFDNSIDAHLMKSKLESEGISCFMFDENVVGLNPLYNMAVGGIKLKVIEADVNKAITIIEEMTNSSLINDKGEVIKCPKCQSEKIYTGFKSMKGFKGILSLFVSFMLVVFPIYYKTNFKCKSCGTSFKHQ